MRKYSIGSRYVSLLLLVAMLLSMVPALQLTADAVYLGKIDETASFLTAADDGVTMLNNGNNISMSIKVNNFAMDGLLFDYLSSVRNDQNFEEFLWEYCKDTSGEAFMQLYPYKTYYDIVGAKKGDFGDDDGIVNSTIKAAESLDANPNTTDVYGVHSTAGTVQRTLIPEVYSDNDTYNTTAYNISADKTSYIRLFPAGTKSGYSYDKGRAWIKLTTFQKTQKVDNVRYAVIIYRLPHGTKQYSNFGLTVNSMDETTANCSKYTTVYTEANGNWQYAIIDLMGLGTKDTRRIASGSNVNTVYLQSPLHWQDNGSGVGSGIGTAADAVYMDIAAVAYFPYYGDAEQFAYAGLTMGCAQKYFSDDNAGFSLRNDSRTHNSTNNTAKTHIKSLPTFYTGDEYLGGRPFGVDTYDSDNYDVTLQDLEALTDVIGGTGKSLLEITGNNMFGFIKGQAALGLVETELGENGRPVYKRSVVSYLATYLRNQLMATPEYPSDNNGWRNYSYITGVSTTGANNEALFGTNELGQSIDLATALCKQIGVEKSSAVVSGTLGNFGGTSNYDFSLCSADSTNAFMGSYNDTLAHKDELLGTWAECKGNIHTWYDAAYFLLNNLYVTETDVADASVDGYGEYENDYQTLIMPQVQYKEGDTTTTPYFFDSGYAYYTDINDSSTWSSALTFDNTKHTITLNGNAQGVAQFGSDITTGQNASSWFPFLPTSGTGTQTGESNAPYYLHPGVLSRQTMGTTYRSRDFHYALSGQGYFAYEPGLYFNFQGDDDVYVYINGQLVVDIGGTHGATSYNMKLDDYVNWAKGIKFDGDTYQGKTYANLSDADKKRVDALCLVTGGMYSFDFFYMERHGVGSNLRIMTNMKIVESGLDVDKFAYQNGIEVIDNGIVNVDMPIEYGFSITNNSDGKLYNLSFSDDIIGVVIDPENGLQVTGDITDSIGAKLTPASLVITVDGYDENGKKLDTINVSCPNNDSLKEFLQTLSADGTSSGDVETDYNLPYSGSGLWKQATVTIRGMYYNMTEAQKKVSNFTNSVIGSGFAKIAGEDGKIEDAVLRGLAKHTVYQPGQPAYYQWVGNPIVIESEQLYEDLLAGNIVESANDLPLPGNMALIPSDPSGTELASEGLSNTPGGDVYLKVNYQTPGSYMAYVTIRDITNDTFSMTVPITIYAVGGQDSTFVLDYGLTSYLTENDAIFDYELDAAAGNVDGSILGISDKTQDLEGNDDGLGYQEYDENAVISAVGQIDNPLELVNGSYDSSTGNHTGAVYQLDTPIFLDHNKPWVIEWKAKHVNGNTLLFSGEKTSGEGNFYLYACTNKQGIYFGEHALEHIDVDGKGIGTSALYNNYGIQDSRLKKDTENFVTYTLINEPDGAGGNTVYCYVNGTKIGAMDDYHQGNTAYADYADQTYMSGRDFTFNYMGTTGHPLADIYEYIHVYENGYQMTHYQWEMPDANTAVDKVVNSVDTGDTGYVENGTTYKEYTIASSGNHKSYWTLNQPVTLAHDESWEISATVDQIDASFILMSAKDTSVANSTHIFLRPWYKKDADGNVIEKHMMVHMGYRDGVRGSHVNYGVDVTEVIPDFSMVDKHTYVLKNVVLPTGNNMVYLYVDDTYIGPLDDEHWGAYDLQVKDTNGISGLDFTFHNIGCDSKLGFGFFDNNKLYNLEIRTKTTLSNVYEWVPGGSGLSGTAATDTKGNQIIFTSDADGVVEAADGKFQLDSKGLKFSVTDMMDDRYSAYVAMAIHEKGFAPTALAVDGIDIRHEAQMYKKITVLPANVVYYEDDFPAVHYYGTAVNSFASLGNVSTDYSDYSDTKYYATGSSENLTQSPDQDSPYGSDSSYQNIFANASGSSLHTIAINNDGPLAWFGFKGTGFELDARTSATQAGMIYVEIYEKGNVTLDDNGNPQMGTDGFIDGTPVKIIPVLPQFDSGNQIGDGFQTENGGNEAIYQVPVMTVQDLTYGDYIVVISGVESLNYEDNNAHMDSYLFLDGIRIYNPLGLDVPEYTHEQSMTFVEIRQQITDGHILVSDYDESNGLEVGTGLMTWTEKYDNRDYTGKAGYIGHAVDDVNDYLMDGPNNEVYLDGTFTNGALVLYVRQTSGSDNLLHVGVRALDAGLYYGAGSTGMRANLMLGVMGTTASGTTEPGWHYVATVASGTEQYYNIPYTLAPVVTIDGNLYHQVVLKVEAYSENIPAMLSFTNLKHTEGLSICESEFIAADRVDAEGNPVMETGIGYTLMRSLTSQMSAYYNFTINEAEPGANFTLDDTVADETAAAIIPSYPSLSFEDEVRYNIYFQTANLEDVALEDMGLITFDSQLTDGTIAEAVNVIPGALYNGTNYVVHTNGIPAKNLGDDLYFKVYAKLADGTYVYSQVLSYSAVEYARYALETSDDVNLKSLMVAMLNYGAAAQEFFSYRTDALMNAELTADQSALVAAYSQSMATPVAAVDPAKVGQFVATDGFASKQISMSFTGAFMLNYYLAPSQSVDLNMTMYYWDAETYNGVSQLTPENATGRVLMAPTDSGAYVGRYTGVAAKDMGDTVYVAVVYESNGQTLCSGVVAYSIDCYCASQAANDASMVKDLAAATTVYGYYAKNYFAN